MAPTQSQAKPVSADKNKSGYTLYKNIKDDLPRPITSNEFFPLTNQFNVNYSNWQKLLPYRFLILKASKKKTPNLPSPDGSAADPVAYNILAASSLAPLSAQVVPVFTFPLAPQSISIDMPFASQTTVLSDGILVESNGAPLRMMTISGTTGVMPFRELGDQSVGAGFGVFDNVANAAKAIGKTTKNIAANAQAIGGQFAGFADDPVAENTGFAQFHKLREFLELWALISKRPENKDLRLAFDMAKDNATYLVTPKRFVLNRDASSPLEYRYSIQLEAWKKIKIGGAGKESLDESLAKGVFENISRVQALVQTVQGIRKILQQIANIGNAIRADFAKLINMVREVILIAKDIAGIAKDIVDLPGDLIRAAKGPILSAIKDVETAWKDVAASIAGFPANFMQSLTGESNQGTINAQGNVTIAGALSTKQQGLAGTDTNSSRPGPQGGSVAPPVAATPLLDSILNDPAFGDPFLSVVQLDQLTLPINLQSKIQAEIDRVRQFTRQDFVEMKTFVEQFSRDSAVAFGLGDRTTDATMGYYSVAYPSSTRRPSRQEYQFLSALRSFVKVLNELTAFEINGKNSINESFNFVGNLAASADISLNISPSKMAVPVIYEKTLSEMAQFYLGDSGRASEIALLNGLVAPFIDEEGTYATLLSNATNNSFNISDGSALYIGQKIILQSDTVVPFSRSIVDIKRLSNSNWLITISGNAISSLKLVNNAKIRYFQRGTVNSNNTIFIPSNVALSGVPARLRPLPYYFDDVDGLARFTGVDIAIGSNNDVIMSKNGDVGLVGGLANLQQALKIKFLTPRGALLRHPGFGSGVQPGTAVADITAFEIRESAVSTVGSDPRFSEVQFMSVQIEGPILKISGGVSINYNSSVLPFSLAISP